MHILSIFPFVGLLIISLLITFKAITLKRKGILIKGANSKPAGSKRLLYLFFLLILGIWLIALAGQTFNLHPFLHKFLLTKKLVESPALTASGAVILVLSVILMAITLTHFKTSLRFGLNKNNQGELITSGVFAFSRNPFFLSLNLYFIGQALVFPGVVFIAITLMSIIGIHLFILKEEKFLQAHYGSLYSGYMQAVRRYF